MKTLNLTDAQFQTLIQLVYLGNFMANATRSNEEIVQQFEDLEQYLYSSAEEFGCGGFVTKHDAVEGVYPSHEFEEMMDAFICKYDTDVFWEELLQKMTERDLLARYGEKAVAEMSIVERIEKEREFIQSYDKEFSLNGLKRLFIKNE
jgi:hypothetical protein